MKRRKFLRLLGLGAGAMTVAPMAVADKPSPDSLRFFRGEPVPNLPTLDDVRYLTVSRGKHRRSENDQVLGRLRNSNGFDNEVIYYYPNMVTARQRPSC